MNHHIRILIVEDSEEDTILLLHALRKGGYDPTYIRVETEEDMISALETQQWDLVISDYVLPVFNGLTALKVLRERDLDLPFIIISGRIGEDTAVEAMKMGANDYLIKGSISRLIPAIEREIQEAATRRGKKLAEAELIKSEQRYKRLVNAVTDYIYHVKVANGSVASTSHGPGCLAVTGYTSDEYAENPSLWYEMIIDEDRPLVQELSRKIAAREEIGPIEHRITRKDGTIRWVMNTVVPRYNTAGNLVAYDGLVSDITERKKAEEELLLQSTALNAAANAIVITDVQGRVLWTNQAFEALTGYPLNEIIGQSLNLLKSGNHGPDFYAGLWQDISEGKVWHGEMINRRKDGSLYNEEQTITPVRSGTGEISHYIAIKQDITQRKLAEKALLDNAQMMMEMEVGKKIQLSLLPEHPPAIPGVTIAGNLVAASHVGGDYYDYFQRGSQGIDLVIADVTGHSIGSALIMAEARGLLHSLYTTDISVAEILQSLGRLLYDDLSRAELFVTIFYARYDSQSNLLSYADAGHNPPLMYNRETRSFQELDAEGLMLGVKIDFHYEERQVSIREGDLLVLFTDGIIEACNPSGELFGLDRLKKLISDKSSEEPAMIIEALFRELSLFTLTSAFQDDVSMVVVKFT
ncbi:SpoIIE family protein phosphatase [Geobacter pelophilus]|uniref:SpoIIE family protein phosphatase n=1 Tax=Geoanaerobacter pelophilus TaxID=60036 RepID=A0AAW4L600_9BACT|nr:SpoIIE family protein phosphatase [Geoanaerobacter pelophilus]MBT0664977.1 SpoIIE family protein phosphatase [Geoanaerobacter pelophilus]